MPPPDLRKARIDVPLPLAANHDSTTLAPGEYFVEQGSDGVRVFSDAAATRHAGDVRLVDFLAGLAKRQVVFLSWG
jgi:hypothetical protein